MAATSHMRAPRRECQTRNPQAGMAYILQSPHIQKFTLLKFF
jgi:hypothetical protein